LGMTVVLEEEGIAIVGEEARPAALALMAGHLRPDAVVLDLEQATSRDLGERVRAAAPETTVVFWARDEDVMEVVDPGASEPRRVFDPEQQELRSAVARSQVNRVER
jgi:DNA-binding NarL/FixJ family response regulator